MLSSRQQALIDDLLLIENVQERLAAVVDRARRQPALPEAARTEANRIVGCQSQVWIVSAQQEDRLQFQGDSDSPLVRGLVALTCDFFSDERADHLQTQRAIDPLALLGLNRQLSSTRQTGLAAVRARLHALAQRNGSPPYP